MILDTIQQAVIMKPTYDYLVTDFGDFSALQMEDRCVSRSVMLSIYADWRSIVAVPFLGWAS